MKKLFLAVALAAMGLLFAGCGKESAPESDLAQKLMGQWVLAYKDNEPVLTNSKIVYNYVSTTKAYLSASLNANPERGTIWGDYMEADVVIRGSKVTVTYHPGENSTTVNEFSINAINSSEFSAYARVTVTSNGSVVLSEQGPVRFQKINKDYSSDVLGLWEGRMVSSESEYDDGQEHRWLFKENGTFVFFMKNDKGIWEAMDDEISEYFVAGNLLCTRWKNAGEGQVESREWWEITALGENGMVWTASREKKDGTKYTSAFSMHKVDVPTQAQIEKAIVGKWINAEKNGEPCLTDSKGVYTFLNTTSAYMSASVSGRPGLGNQWHDLVPLDVEIIDNNILLSHRLDEHKFINIDMAVTSIDENEMHADVHATLTVDGTIVGTVDDHIRYEKMKVNYRKAILGIWEGRRTSGGSTEYHRWEYFEDGTYNFYFKVGEGQWVKMEDEFSQYFVDGRLLCTRWKNAGEETVENREWWEIRSIEEDTMIWTGLRKDDLGERYVESFTMYKVQVPTADEIREKIRSTKWMIEKINGLQALTNEKAVFTFFSKTQATISASFDEVVAGEKDWVRQRDFEYVVEGNKITFTHKDSETSYIVDEMIVGYIDSENIHGLFKRTVYEDGRELPYPTCTLELKKQEKMPRYSSYILGCWLGRVTSAYSQYDDGKQHLWEFDPSTYAYYVEVDGKWVLSDDTLNEYFIDGSLLLMRWIENDIEYREWWEILSMDEDSMIWTALREDEYGDRYTATVNLFKMPRN
jgi:hypothetical protein